MHLRMIQGVHIDCISLDLIRISPLLFFHSVLYFSWHRYERQKFWPELRESDYDSVGKDKGAGFNINLPWNKVSDLDVVLHLPLIVVHILCTLKNRSYFSSYFLA